MSSLDDWQARWYDWLERRSQKVTLGYSIRRCNEDEIEIHASIFDGLVRGYIRGILFAIMLVNIAMSPSGSLPFADEVKSFQRDFQWAFHLEDIVKAKYEEREKKRILSEQEGDPFARRKMTYEEYKAPYIEGIFWKKLKIFAYGFGLFVLIFIFFWPRTRGLRVNRRERIIYWQLLGRDHSTAFVPDQGDPLSGLAYNKFGLYAFGFGQHFSLAVHMHNLESGLNSSNYFGIYPTPSKEHNDDLVNAIRAFLNEDNPEFLSRIGKRFKTPWTRPMMLFCNLFAWPKPFWRRRADTAMARAKGLWAKRTPQEQAKWFSDFRALQRKIDQDLREDGFDNHIPWADPRKR